MIFQKLILIFFVKEKLLCAIEALQLLAFSGPSNHSIENNSYLYNSAFDSYMTIKIPSLDRTSAKPRALLQYIPLSKRARISEISLENLVDELLFKSSFAQDDDSQEEYFLPIYMTRRSISIGNDPKMDVCLKRLIQNTSFNCDQVSKKHASIYYDNLTDTYELLNYSENGTLVDNCLYGFDLEQKSECESFFSSKIIKFDSVIAENKTNHTTSPFFKKKIPCNCRFTAKPSSFRQWEGPAHLKHGSLVQIGCLSFLFIIVDYDFVLEKPSYAKKTGDKVAYKVGHLGSKHTDDKKTQALEELLKFKQEFDTNDVLNERSTPDLLNNNENKFNVNKKQLLI